MCIIIMSKGYVVELLICFDIAQPPNNTLIANLDMNEKSNFEIIALMNKLILPLMEWHTVLLYYNGKPPTSGAIIIIDAHNNYYYLVHALSPLLATTQCLQTYFCDQIFLHAPSRMALSKILTWQ